MVLIPSALAIQFASTKNVDESLYPASEPFNEGYLSVGDGYQLWYAEYGNPEGIPGVYFHGGPMAGCTDEYRLFNPETRRIVLFDQRGAGKSIPLGEIKANTLPINLEDAERIREHLGIDKWQVVGGSCGGTMALEYGNRYPERILGGIVLRAPYIPTKENGYYITRDVAGVPELHSVSHASYMELAEEGVPIEETYFRLLTCGDRAVELDAARRFMWYDWVKATPNPDEYAILEAVEKDLPLMRAISLGFFGHHLNDFFLDTPFFDDLQGLNKIAVTAVSGTADYLCPPCTVDPVKALLPHMNFYSVDGEGHSQKQCGMAELVVKHLEEQIAAVV